MKIGILTFHHSLNCGAELQAWALQTYLQSCGYDAEIVNYGRIGWPSRWYVRLDSLRHIAGTVYGNTMTLLRTLGIEHYRQHLYRCFQRECMRLGRAVSKDEINRRGYTHLITGSDQVWHPIINEGDETYFLANALDGVKRISYAPSFGMDTFDPSLEKKMAVWLSKFDSLSVREPQGSEIVKRICGWEAQVVCDPTLLLDAASYEKQERMPRLKLPEKYIAVYTICGHPWAEQFAALLAKQKGVPVVHLLGGQLASWYWPNGILRRVTALGPSEWLYFMRQADCVVTNSFHGTVFSLIFHRPFWVTLNDKMSDVRLTTILDGTSCEDRALAAFRPPESESVIDWKTVDREMERKAETGKAYLRQALGQSVK